MNEKRFRQFAPFVLLSVLVHIVGLGVFEYLQLWSTRQEAVRVRFSATRHYTFTLGNGTEGVGLGGQAVPHFQYVPEAQSTSEPESGGSRFPVFGRDMEPGGKEEWQDTGDRVGAGELGRSSADSVAKAFEIGQHSPEGRSEDSELSDPMVFDVERRVRTTAVIDRKTGKLKKAYLYLPCYRNHPYVVATKKLRRCPPTTYRGRIAGFSGVSALFSLFPWGQNGSFPSEKMASGIN